MDWSPLKVDAALRILVRPIELAAEQNEDDERLADSNYAWGVASGVCAETLAHLADLERIEPEIIFEVVRLGRPVTGEKNLRLHSRSMSKNARLKDIILKDLKRVQANLAGLDGAGEVSLYSRIALDAQRGGYGAGEFSNKHGHRFAYAETLQVSDLVGVIKCAVELTPPTETSLGAPTKTLKQSRIDLAWMSYARLRFEAGCDPENIFKRGDCRYPLKLYELMAGNDGSSEGSLKRKFADRRRFWRPFVQAFATELVDRKLKGKPLDLPFSSLLVPDPFDPWLVMCRSEEQENIRRNKGLENNRYKQKVFQEEQAKMVARWIEEDKNRSTETD